MAKMEKYSGKFLVELLEDWLSDVRANKDEFAREMSNASPRLQGEFWLLTQAFMVEMAQYHDPQYGITQNNQVALECAVTKKLWEDAFPRQDS
jgi:hypothetical protein